MDTDSRTTQTLARPPLSRFFGRAVRNVFRIDEGVCIEFGECSEICEFGAMRRDGGGTRTYDFAECLGCGLCVEHCGSGGLTLEIDPARGLPLDLDLAREVLSRGKYEGTHARTADH